MKLKARASIVDRHGHPGDSHTGTENSHKRTLETTLKTLAIGYLFVEAVSQPKPLDLGVEVERSSLSNSRYHVGTIGGAAIDDVTSVSQKGKSGGELG